MHQIRFRLRLRPRHRRPHSTPQTPYIAEFRGLHTMEYTTIFKTFWLFGECLNGLFDAL